MYVTGSQAARPAGERLEPVGRRHGVDVSQGTTLCGQRPAAYLFPALAWPAAAGADTCPDCTAALDPYPRERLEPPVAATEPPAVATEPFVPAQQPEPLTEPAPIEHSAEWSRF